jgi:RNA polymerase sigma-70 factor (ECF subfamily)
VAHELEHDYLIQAQAGDPTAFDLLHLSLEPALLRFVRRLVGDDHLAEDIVQDTFITLYTHLDDIYPPEKLRPFLFRVARNKAYDVLRRGGRYDMVSLDDEPLEARVSFHADKSQAPDEIAHWLLLYLEVQEAIDKLPEHHRQTLILYCEEELSYAEIADVMGVNIGTVKSRLFHAKKTLRGLVNPKTILAIQQTDEDETQTDEVAVVKNKLSIEDSVEEDSHGRESKNTTYATLTGA